MGRERLKEFALTEEQQKTATKWYEHARRITIDWAARKNAIWCLNDLLSAAGWAVVRCIIGYDRAKVKSDDPRAFSKYLSVALKNALYTELLNVTGFKLREHKDRPEQGKYVTIFVNLEDDLFDDSVEKSKDQRIKTNAVVEDKGFAWVAFKDFIEKASGKINERDIEILIDLYVYDMTLQEVADEYGYTRQWAQQKRDRLLRILRKSLLK